MATTSKKTEKKIHFADEVNLTDVKVLPMINLERSENSDIKNDLCLFFSEFIDILFNELIYITERLKEVLRTNKNDFY